MRSVPKRRDLLIQISKVNLFEEIRREYEFGVLTIHRSLQEAEGAPAHALGSSRLRSSEVEEENEDREHRKDSTILQIVI